LKIAHIGLRGLPASYSGIEKAVEELCTRLVKKDHEITIFCMARKNDKRIKNYRGLTLKYIPTIRSKNLEMFVYAFLASILSAFGNYDIVHFHALGPSTLSIIPKIFGKIIVVTVQGLDWKRQKWSFIAKQYLKIGEWTSIRFSEKTIVVSKKLKRYYENRYKRNVEYIPNGIDIPKQLPLDNAQQKFSIEKNNYLLFVGRLSKEKRVDLLIQAFNMLKTDKKLVIVGGSQYSDDYTRKLKKLSCSNKKIIFTGPIYDDMLKQIYSNAYLFVLPSEIEGLALVLLEALAYGNCVLVSDIPENIEVIKNSDTSYGFSFRSGKIESLRSALQDLIDYPDKVSDLKNKGKTIIARRYRWDKIADKTLKIYEGLIKNK
jgi:glycosyltransferase involved in cell wall biosynthesis